MIAAAVTTRAPWPNPGDDGLFGVCAVDVLLAHACDEEDLVVHDEHEDDADQEDGQHADDWTGLAHAEQVGQPAALDHRDHGAERGQDDEQEPEGGLERDEDGTEDQRQQHQCRPTTSSR